MDPFERYRRRNRRVRIPIKKSTQDLYLVDPFAVSDNRRHGEILTVTVCRSVQVVLRDLEGEAHDCVRRVIGQIPERRSRLPRYRLIEATAKDTDPERDQKHG